MINAAINGHEGVIQLLLEKGADFNIKDKDGETALIKAVRCWNEPRAEAIVRLLLEKGADVKAQDQDGKTALTKAARYGHKGVIRLLTSAGNS